MKFNNISVLTLKYLIIVVTASYNLYRIWRQCELLDQISDAHQSKILKNIENFQFIDDFSNADFSQSIHSIQSTKNQTTLPLSSNLLILLNITSNTLQFFNENDINSILRPLTLDECYNHKLEIIQNIEYLEQVRVDNNYFLNGILKVQNKRNMMVNFRVPFVQKYERLRQKDDDDDENNDKNTIFTVSGIAPISPNHEKINRLLFTNKNIKSNQFQYFSDITGYQFNFNQFTRKILRLKYTNSDVAVIRNKIYLFVLLLVVVTLQFYLFIFRIIRLKSVEESLKKGTKTSTSSIANNNIMINRQNSMTSNPSRRSEEGGLVNKMLSASQALTRSVSQFQDQNTYSSSKDVESSCAQVPQSLKELTRLTDEPKKNHFNRSYSTGNYSTHAARCNSPINSMPPSPWPRKLSKTYYLQTVTSLLKFWNQLTRLVSFIIIWITLLTLFLIYKNLQNITSQYQIHQKILGRKERDLMGSCQVCQVCYWIFVNACMQVIAFLFLKQ